MAAAVGSDVARQQLTRPHPGIATLDVSGDGRVVAFVSAARLTPLDTNGVDDVYVLDRESGRITLESVGVSGRAANGTSEQPRLSHDGRVLVFTTVATDAVEPPTTTPWTQVVRRDREAGVTALVSRTPAGDPANGTSREPDISGDGRVVVFQSTATDLVMGPDANGTGSDIYAFDASTGTMNRVTVTSLGEQPTLGFSGNAAVDGAGRYVVFTSTAALDAPSGRDLLPPRPTADRQVFVRDLWLGVTTRVSRTTGGGVPDGASFHPAISADGRFVAFASSATDLVDPRPGDARRRRAQPGIFLYHAASRRITHVSRPPLGDADGASRHPVVSGDGRYVVFSSEASNLVCVGRCPSSGGNLNLVSDVYRFDTRSQSIQSVSGRAGRESWWVASAGPALDATGRIVAFSSRHPIDALDLDHDDDLFVEELPDPPRRTSRN